MKPLKTLYLTLLTVFTVQCAFAQTGKVTITGRIINISNKMQVGDASELKSLSLPNDERSFIPDAAGNFSVTFNLSRPGYFRIGRNFLYLSPGDNLNAKIDYADAMKAVFTGSGVAANNYLRGNLYPHAGSYLEAGKRIQPNFPRTIDTILFYATAREKELEQTQNITPEFRKFEQARIKADVINSLMMIKSYFPYRYKLTPEDWTTKFENAWLHYIAPVKAKYAQGLADPANLCLEAFTMRVEDVLDKDDTSPQAAKIRDWMKASDIAYKIQHMGSKEEIIAMKQQVDAIATPLYKKTVTDTYNNLIKFGNGDKAIDFTALTADGKKVKMSEFAGKVIFVDLWATWCGPCIAEFPAMEKLKARYKDNPNVVFVTISIDDDKDAWKKKLASMSDGGLQVIADRATLNDYSVIDIPRTIVIDKNFKIAAMKGNLPSAPQTVKLLDDLLLK